MTKRKLTFEQAEEVRRKAKKGAKQVDLAKEYNIGTRAISEIIMGYRYAEPWVEAPKQPPRVIKGIDPKARRKLTPEQVRLVRKELALKTTIKEIAKMVGVGANAIKDIRDGVTYRDVR
jgi:hypothetical protein